MRARKKSIHNRCVCAGVCSSGRHTHTQHTEARGVGGGRGGGLYSDCSRVCTIQRRWLAAAVSCEQVEEARVE